MPAPQPPSLTARILRFRRVRQGLALALLAAVSVSAAFLLPPSRFTPAIPGDDALGKPFSGTLKANRDYDVLDPETTAEKRDEAARSVWPVYDFDRSAAEVLQRRIADAFAQAREALAQWKRNNPAKAPHLASLRPGRRIDREVLELVLSGRDEFWKTLQAVIDDDEYLELARSGFDASVEHAAARLAGLAATGFIVEERGLLAADRDRGGIAVRTLPGPLSGGPYGAPLAEQTVRDIDRIKDLARARAEVERLAAEQVGELSLPLRHGVAQLVRRSLRPNLAYNEGETRRRQEAKRQQVKDVLLQIKKGEKIIGDGEQVTKTHLLIFQALRAAGRASEAEQVRWGGGLFAALVCAAVFEFGRRNVRKFRLRSRDVVLMAALLVGQLLLVRGALAGADALHELVRDQLPVRFALPVAQALPAAIPFALGSLLVRFLLQSEAALLWTAAFAPLCGLLAGGSLQVALAALVGGIVAADRIGHAGSRSAVFRAGLFTGLATAVVLTAFSMFQGRLWSLDAAATVAAAVLGGAILMPILALILAALLEAVFGYVTDIELLKLASFNHPVLKDLIVQAPGTYHHAILIGQLVEAAAREIGANPLLARVGAYYHDIGKGKNPLFFGENQKGENRHDQISPQISAQIIQRHVQDGIELARQAKLPRQVIDFIPQHHGTRAIAYFLHRAKEEAERTGGPPPGDGDFRYAGPKPQTRETALVMIADAVVATARNLSTAAPEKLRALVDRAIQAVVAEGQLDECEITLRDLERTAQSFAATLATLYRAPADLPPSAQRPALRVLESDVRRA
ncbi:MAG: HDIG domain-containing protein [Deltaproteobacteria bacterium]|nr:MAG: HDIG domain-containing protein [Deltaproteobacteria bacterium]